MKTNHEAPFVPLDSIVTVLGNVRIIFHTKMLNLISSTFTCVTVSGRNNILAGILVRLRVHYVSYCCNQIQLCGSAITFGMTFLHQYASSLIMFTFG